MNQIKTTIHAIVVHGLDDALAAVAAAREIDVPLTLVSAPNAGAYAGAGWFLEIVAQSRAAAPGLAVSGLLDCADHTGHAIAALRAGAKAIIFTGDDQVAERLTAMAEAEAATLHRAYPAAFDPGDAKDKQAACRDWLARR